MPCSPQSRRADLINDLQSFGCTGAGSAESLNWQRCGPATARWICAAAQATSRWRWHTAARKWWDGFTEQMLAVARKRSQCLAFSVQEKNPQFIRGDAQRIPFDDAVFDIVTVGYGLRNLANWKTGLSEMMRVARPGARLLVLDFGRPDHPLWRTVYFGYLKRFCTRCWVWFSAGTPCLCVYSRIAETLPGATRHGGTDE
jgi:demethylmenaquinone methyltransferase/2-methoxy-6-polyprenyl-1,4-benzoquinol methylase